MAGEKMNAGRENREATITIRRVSPEDGQQRQVVVKVDGADAGELMYGDTLTIPVSAGRHTLKVDNTWNSKAVQVDVGAGEHLKFQTVNRVGKLTWFLVSLLGVGPMYVSIERES